MKKLLLLILNITFIYHAHLWAQNIQTDTLKVYGYCEMCKSRIERAAFIKGVISAKWSPKTKMLIVQYKPQKVSRQAIEQSILNVGHDLEHQKAKDEIYNQLHNCCRYRDEK